MRSDKIEKIESMIREIDTIITKNNNHAFAHGYMNSFLFGLITCPTKKEVMEKVNNRLIQVKFKYGV